MRKQIQLVACVLMLAIACAAESRLDDLKHRAEHEKEQNRGPAYVAVAREYIEMADHEFDAGDNAHAQADVQQGVSYAEKAVQSALEKGKKLKETEIDLRKVANRVEEMRRAAAVEEQPALEVAHKKLEDLRTQLLNRLFK